MAANMNRVMGTPTVVELLRRLEGIGNQARNLARVYAAHGEMAGIPVNVPNIPLAPLPIPNNQQSIIRPYQPGFFSPQIHNVTTTSTIARPVVSFRGGPGGPDEPNGPGGGPDDSIQQASDGLWNHIIEFCRYLLNTTSEWINDHPLFKAFLGATIGAILCYYVLFPASTAFFSGIFKLLTDRGITQQQLNDAGHIVRFDLGISLQINSLLTTGTGWNMNLFSAGGIVLLGAVCTLSQAFIDHARGYVFDLQANDALGNLNNGAIREITDAAIRPIRAISDQGDTQDKPPSPRPR